MKLLATGIKFNNGLQSLNLSHNSLAKEGAEALGSCFSYNTSICDLDLDFNDMFDPGGELIFTDQVYYANMKFSFFNFFRFESIFQRNYG